MRLLKKKETFPKGSVKDAAPYEGSLKDFIAEEEAWLAEQRVNFRLAGLLGDDLFVPAIFTMVELVQHKDIHNPDFFGKGIFVDYDGEDEERSFPSKKESHHSGWRLLKQADQAEGVVVLAPSNPNYAVEFLVEGQPGDAWVNKVIRTYYIARRASLVAQAAFQQSRR